MSGECAPDDFERQLHHGFIGRDDLLDELTRLVLHDASDRCVALLGRPGTGKTAIVTRWLMLREAEHDLVFAHFIRRQHGDTAEPWRIARSLTAQIERRFPDLADPFARPEARLAGLISRASARELAPHGRRMALVIDGLDARPAGSELRDVLACLPRALPRGVRLVLAGSLQDARRELDGRYGQVTTIDLDDAQRGPDNDAAVRAFWNHEAQALALDDRLVAQAIRRADGNLLHAALLARHFACVPRSLHEADAIPRDLPALLTMLWQRVADDRAAVRVLEILCAAREPLSLDQIARAAGLSNPGDLRAAIMVARVLISETLRDRVTVFSPSHAQVRRFVAERIGPVAVRGHHRDLTERLAPWPPPRDPWLRRYALLHAVGHCIAAGDHRALHALASSGDFLAAKAQDLGIDEVELDVRRAAEACLGTGHMAPYRDLDRLARALARDSSSHRRDAGDAAAQLVRRVQHDLRLPDHATPGASVVTAGTDPPRADPPRADPPRADPPRADPPRADPPRADAVSQRSRPALLAALSGRRGGVTACAVTPDGRRAVVAYADHSLGVWDLDAARQIAALAGHAAAIAGCAITPDGRRAVSASADATLKVWDLDTGQPLATLDGHAGPVTSCAVTPDGRRAVSGSTDATIMLWDLHTGAALATFDGHGGPVTSCAVSPDGRWMISASADTTLKIWELDTGELLATFRGHTATVATCAITADARRVVSGSTDHTLKIWDVGTANATTTLHGHTGAVVSVVSGPDRRSVYSASSDATVRIWDLDTGREVTMLEGHTGAVTCCAVSPDGRRLISGSADSTLRIWALDGSRTATLAGGTHAAQIAVLPGLATPRARKPRGGKPLILFLAANAKGGSQRVLEEECAAIDRELVMARHGGDFEYRSKWALTVDEMARHLLDLDPTIVHFRGQGRQDAAGGSPPARQAPSDDSGIYLRDERGGLQRVTGRALKMMVQTSAPSARVVVLNACYSDEHAAELCQVVECVAGMTRDQDHAAMSFAIAFYRALGHRRSIGEAMAHAVAMLAAKLVPDECIPRCRTQNWVDPHDISLVSEPALP